MKRWCVMYCDSSAIEIEAPTIYKAMKKADEVAPHAFLQAVGAWELLEDGTVVVPTRKDHEVGKGILCRFRQTINKKPKRDSLHVFFGGSIMATKRKIMPVATCASTKPIPAPFDLEARMASAMTPQAQIEAGVDSDSWRIKRAEWAESVPFVQAIVEVLGEVDANVPRPNRRTDRSRLIEFRVAIEGCVGHLLHEKEGFQGIVSDIRLSRKPVNSIMADVIEIDVKTPESMGGGITTVQAVFI